jgi:hypothetical protein
MSEIIAPVAIKLDKERHLRLTLNGMVKFRQTTGKDLLKGFDMDEMSADDIRALLWACLVWEDKDLTLEDVGDMIDMHNMPAVIKALTGSIFASFPDPEETSDPNPANRLES